MASGSPCLVAHPVGSIVPQSGSPTGVGKINICINHSCVAVKACWTYIVALF